MNLQKLCILNEARVHVKLGRDFIHCDCVGRLYNRTFVAWALISISHIQITRTLYRYRTHGR